MAFRHRDLVERQNGRTGRELRSTPMVNGWIVLSLTVAGLFGVTVFGVLAVIVVQNYRQRHRQASEAR